MAVDPLRVVVVGAGGIASWLVPGIARALEFNAPGSQILLIDGDTFEPKNLERQTFSQLGNKAQVMRKDLAHQFTETIIIAKAAWVVPEGSASNVEDEDNTVKIAPSDFMREGDHIFVVVDNFAARALIFDAARNFNNIDIYTGGNGEDLSGSTYHYIRRNGEDLTHHPSVFHEEFVNPPDRNPGLMSCAQRAKLEGGTQILAANMCVAALLLSKVSSYIFGEEREKERSEDVVEIQFDMAYGKSLPYCYRPDNFLKPDPLLVDVTQ